MNFKSIFLGLIIGIFSVQALACNWFRTGKDGEYLECRTNYKNFIGANSQAVNRISEMAKNLALGELQKISNESWAIRQAITVDESQKLRQNRTEAKAIVDAINDELRRRSAIDETVNWDDAKDLVPAAWVFGVTVPVKEIPLNKLVSRIPALQVSGSMMVGVVVIPQMVKLKLDSQGNEVEISGAERLAFDTRVVMVPSADARAGNSSGLKQVGRQLSVGMVFGENIFSSHQLLGQGYSASLPSKVAATASGFSPLSFILKAADKIGVDTIKIGVSKNAQNPEGKAQAEGIKTYSETVWLWLRWDNGKKLDEETAAQATVEGIAKGKFRGSAFWVLAPWSDGESNSVYNGLSGDGAAIFTDILKDVAGEYMTPEEMSDIADAVNLTPDQKDALTQELKSRGVSAE